jgi:hypothetical protein
MPGPHRLARIREQSAVLYKLCLSHGLEEKRRIATLSLRIKTGQRQPICHLPPAAAAASLPEPWAFHKKSAQHLAIVLDVANYFPAS